MLEIIKVTSKKEVSDFIHLTDYIYKNCPQYVPDLRADVRALIATNGANSEHGALHIQPFVAYRHEVPVGRIVGIINKRANEKWKTKNVRFSLIEFIDDLEVSAALLNAVSEWGQSFGMTHIQGPLGITDFDKEGMLVENFDMMGSPSTIYNLDSVLQGADGTEGDQGIRKHDSQQGLRQEDIRLAERGLRATVRVYQVL